MSAPAPELRVLRGGVDVDAGTLPPHDPEAERAVVGALLTTGRDRGAGIDAVLAMLEPRDFFVGSLARIFEAATDLADRGESCDSVAVATWLRDRNRLAEIGGMAALAELLNAVPSVQERAVLGYARTVRDRSRQRGALALCQRTAAELYAGSIGDTGAYLEAFERDVYDLARPDVAGTGAEHVSAALRRDAARLQSNEPPHAFGTGYPLLDRILGGGLRPKGLSILGGLTSSGKSALAMNVATSVARVAGVFFASLEMTADELAQRAACGASGVPIEHVREKRMSQAEWSRYIGANAEIAQLPLFIADEPGQSITTIRAKARRLAAEMRRKGGRLGLVAVDYLQLLKPLPGPKNETREQQVAALSRNLKGIAKDLDVHVLALAQLNAGHESRKGDEKRPRLGDLRESRAIANDADVVLFVHREDYQAERDDRDGRAPARGHAELIVAKHRGGPTGVVPLIFDRHRCRFENPPTLAAPGLELVVCRSCGQRTFDGNRCRACGWNREAAT